MPNEQGAVMRERCDRLIADIRGVAKVIGSYQIQFDCRDPRFFGAQHTIRTPLRKQAEYWLDWGYGDLEAALSALYDRLDWVQEREMSNFIDDARMAEAKRVRETRIVNILLDRSER